MPMTNKNLVLLIELVFCYVENIVRKGDNALDKYTSFYPKCLQKPPSFGVKNS